MALSYTRLLCRKTINLGSFRCLYTQRPLSVAVSKPASSEFRVTHDEKNMSLRRPLSPHLTIYQIQLTALLSITHRTTGIILSTYAAILGLGTIYIPGGIPCLIEGIAGLGLPTAVLFTSKLLLALPITYHTFNGLRHLAWDMGRFLTIKEVYSTGYMVSILSIAGAIALAIM